MSDTINNREASATIRGYIYQFDATIRKILASNIDDSCIVESVEDFDIQTSDLSSYFQCKYYASQKLTSSVLRDAILPMIKHFISLQEQERASKRYFLYGHFKESSFENSALTIDVLKDTLVRREKQENADSDSKFRVINVQNEIGATDDDLSGFINAFSFELCNEYEKHKKDVISELKGAVNVSETESELFVYPTALSIISNLACGQTVQARTITKYRFLQMIRPNKALYNIWSMREKRRTTYCREMRSLFFSQSNIDPEARFFILEVPDDVIESDIVRTILAIRRKWSSHTMRRKPNSERYAPFLYLRNIADDSLISIKKSIHQGGNVFVDGYPFLGANFSIESICEQQTYHNKISLRIIYSEEDLDKCFSTIRKNKFIYQFFFEKPLKIENEIPQVCIPVNTFEMITNII